MCNFCHLHMHSNRSFFDGLSPIDELVQRAAELEMPGVALTDHGNIFGAAQLFKECKKAGIKGVIGMEAYEAIPHRWDPEEHGDILKRPFGTGPRYHHLTIWVQNLRGWENLCALHTKSYTKFYKPRNQPLIDRHLLEQHNEGLLIGLGCPASKTNMALQNEGDDAAYEAAKWYKEVFEDRVYCEVMGNLPEQQAQIRPQRKLAQRLGVPCIATNDVHYVDREDGREHGAHHIVVQSRAWRTKQKAEQSADKSDAGFGKWYGTDEFYMKSEAEMIATGGISKEEVHRTVEVLDRIEFDFDQLRRPAPPVAPVPAPGEDPEFDAFLAANT